MWSDTYVHVSLPEVGDERHISRFVCRWGFVTKRHRFVCRPSKFGSLKMLMSRCMSRYCLRFSECGRVSVLAFDGRDSMFAALLLWRESRDLCYENLLILDCCREMKVGCAANMVYELACVTIMCHCAVGTFSFDFSLRTSEMYVR